MTRSLTGLARGAAAGAAGTTALNAVTYLDMALRARPASETPQQSVEQLAEDAHVEIPGDGEERQARLDGLGPLTGILAGVGTGAVVGAVIGGRRTSFPATWLLSTVVALVAGNGPMTVLGISDPRSWSRADWISDLVPHAAYGAVVAATLGALERP
jgi:hypothetical protein